jgi:hypothetical protein
MLRHIRRSLVFAAPAALALALLSVARGDAAPSADPAAAPSRAPVCAAFTATNSALQTRVVTSGDARVSTSTNWTTLPCASTTVTVPRGRAALVTTTVDAEVVCTGAAGQWCEGRVLYDGVEGQPTAPEPDSFAWASSQLSATRWEAASFTRTRPLRCPPVPALTAPCVYGVVTQVRNHAAGLSFRVDDSTVRTQATYY